MLGKPDRGTSVDSVMLGAASNSMPPARTCDSISGSPPSWLLGNTVTLSRPDDCAPIARAASVNRTVRGWVSGVLTPSLNSNSAAALADLPSTVVAKAADVDSSRPLRVIFIVCCLPGALARFGPVSVEPRPSARCRRAVADTSARRADETILRNRRNPPETNQRYLCSHKAAVRTLGGSHEPLNSLGGSRYPPENRGRRAHRRYRGGRFWDLCPDQFGLHPDRPCHKGRQAGGRDQLGRLAGPLGPGFPGIWNAAASGRPFALGCAQD